MIRIADYFSPRNTKASYTSKHETRWTFKKEFEKALSTDEYEIYPICVKGKSASPPEDRGGVDKYDETTLEQVYPLPKSRKLYYHFDFGDDWYFEIHKNREKPRNPEPGVRYPLIVGSIGPAPQQYGSWEDE